MDWFLYDNGLRHERVKQIANVQWNNGYCHIKVKQLMVGKRNWDFFEFVVIGITYENLREFLLGFFNPFRANVPLVTMASIFEIQIFIKYKLH